MDAAGVLNSIHHVPFEQVEIEFRAGVFRKNQFAPGISPSIFDTIHAKLSQEMVFTNQHIIETIHGDYRMRQGGDAMRKIKLFYQDFPEQGYRMSVASETTVPLIDHFTKYNHSFKRQKDRTTFQVPGGTWKIDMTKVLSLQDKDEDRYTHEIEVELVDHTRMLIVPIQVLLAEGIGILDRLIRESTG